MLRVLHKQQHRSVITVLRQTQNRHRTGSPTPHPPSSSTLCPPRGSTASRVRSATRHLRVTPRTPSKFLPRTTPQAPAERRPSCDASHKRRQTAELASKPTRPSARPALVARFAAEIISCAKRPRRLSRSVSGVFLRGRRPFVCACVLRPPACLAVPAWRRPSSAQRPFDRSAALPSPLLPLAVSPR